MGKQDLYCIDATTCPSSGSLRPWFLAIPGNQVLWWFWREPTNPSSLRHVSSLRPSSSKTRPTSTKPLNMPHFQPSPGSSGLDRRRPLDGFDPPGLRNPKPMNDMLFNETDHIFRCHRPHGYRLHPFCEIIWPIISMAQPLNGHDLIIGFITDAGTI